MMDELYLDKTALSHISVKIRQILITLYICWTEV